MQKIRPFLPSVPFVLLGLVAAACGSGAADPEAEPARPRVAASADGTRVAVVGYLGRDTGGADKDDAALLWLAP